MDHEIWLSNWEEMNLYSYFTHTHTDSTMYFLLVHFHTCLHKHSQKAASTYIKCDQWFSLRIGVEIFTIFSF